MKKFIVCFYMLSLALECYSQSIITTFSENIVMDDGYSFAVGDTVSLFGYGKNELYYYFAINNNEYVKRFSHTSIPFNVKEKDLKKLPDALHVSIFDLINNKQEEVKNKIRNLALEGDFIGVITKNYGGTLAEFFVSGDSVRIIGYDKSPEKFNFAILSDDLCGVFWSEKYSFNIPEGVLLNFPTTSDTEVIKIIEANANIIRDIVKEKAIKGEVNAVINDSYFLTMGFNIGDTLCVYGCKDKGTIKEYMLASNTNSRIINLPRLPLSIDKKTLTYLPSTDDEDVRTAFNNRKKEIDAKVEEIKRNEAIREQMRKEQEDSIYNQQIANGYYLSVKSAYITMNSVGLIYPHIIFHNNSKKDIKYLDFSVYFKNAVNDVVYNDINRDRNLLLRITGPILSHGDEIASWNNTSFYAPSADKMFFNSMRITYMDGSVVTMNANKLNEQIME